MLAMIHKTMTRLIQALLIDCWSGVYNMGHDGGSLLRRSVRDPQGSANSTHNHKSYLPQRSAQCYYADLNFKALQVI